MPEVKMPEAALSWDGVIYMVAILVAVSGVLAALLKGWEAYKKISVRDRVRKLEAEMKTVKSRLSKGDKRFALQGDDMGQVLTTMQSLLIHFISGNDHNLLKDNLDGLNQYMNTRSTRMMQIDTQESEESNNE